MTNHCNSNRSRDPPPPPPPLSLSVERLRERAGDDQYYSLHILLSLTDTLCFFLIHFYLANQFQSRSRPCRAPCAVKRDGVTSVCVFCVRGHWVSRFVCQCRCFTAVIRSVVVTDKNAEGGVGRSELTERETGRGYGKRRTDRERETRYGKKRTEKGKQDTGRIELRKGNKIREEAN